MNYINIRRDILSQIYPDFIFNERKNEFITWCDNQDGCNGQHHKRKLQINIEKNIFSCWVCLHKGHVIKLLNKLPHNLRKQYLDTLPDFETKENCEGFIIRLPDEYRFILDCVNHYEGQIAYKWIKENLQISDELIYQFKIGFCDDGKYKNRIIFPSFDINGNLNFFVTRSMYDNSYLKYLNCEGVKSKDIIFNEILVDWQKPLIIVEGCKSHFKFWQIPNVVPIMGSRFNKEYKLFQQSILNEIPKVYIGLDDEAKIKSYDIMEFYYSCGIDVKLIDLNDVNQPDKLNLEIFADRLLNAKSFSKKDILRSKIQELSYRI